MAYKRTRKEFEADLQAQQSPYVFYGTPLPPLDPEVRDDGSYVPVWQQEVRDEQGRKRLHGAFTGGFSAGYFNTVGSKDGWTPSTFVSSRNSRAKDGKAQERKQQRPEDFMDDEDLAEASQAQTVQASDKFAGFGSTQQDDHNKGSLMDIFKPSDDTMGVRLLRKMGWKDGQGIGPKVRRRVDGAQDSEEHHFAPVNSNMIRFSRKDDRKGLGYQGEARLSDQRGKAGRNAESDEDSRAPVFRKSTIRSNMEKQHASVKKSAFGTGVLNDDGSDDDDPYSMGPRISYKKTIASGDSSQDREQKPSSVVRAPSNTTKKSKHTFRSKLQVPTRPPRKCHDGLLPIDGFVLAEPLASLSLVDDEKYAPPRVPDGWTPSQLAKESQNEVPYTSTADAAKASTMDAKSRGAVLGEAALSGKSIFDFMSSATRDKLASASNNKDLPLGRSETMPPGADSKPNSFDVDIPSLDKRTAEEALRRGAIASLKNADEAKKVRFESFLQFHAKRHQDPPKPSQSMTASQWLAELDEFVRSARSFKPMSGLMASRFTSAGVSKPSDHTLKQELSNKSNKPKDAAEEAATMAMFGPMTRSHLQFFPTRLVCKRFGVRPPPHVEDEGHNQPSMTATVRGSSSSARRTTELVSEQAMEQMKTQVSLPFEAEQSSVSQSQASQSKQLRTTRTEEGRFGDHGAGVAEVDPSRNDALEGQKAGEAVFKAVFGDDEDEDDDSD